MNGPVAHAQLPALIVTGVLLLAGGGLAMTKRSLRRRVAPVLLALAGLVAAAAFVTWQQVPTRPAVTCHLANPKPCTDTADWIEFDPDLVFDPQLPGQVRAIDVSTPPPEWAESPKGGYQAAAWAARVH